MTHFHRPQAIDRKFLTPGVIVLLLLAANGLFWLGGRFLFGIGAVTNLNNQYPWGIWIGIDVAAGVALAAGGFTTAALGHVMHREQYHAVVRPALLTAMLGYTMVAIGVSIDIGRYYYIWHPLIMWNGSSALFEVGMCVMIYMTVLYIEFLPIVTERFIGRVDLPGALARVNEPVDRLLRLLDRTLSKTMFVFIIMGVVLSTLHQSSLGTLMVIAGAKMHPLWQTPILPLLFLLSAISVGFPMVIFESLIAARSFGLKPEMHILGRMGRMVATLLGIYLAAKLGDLFIRETFVYLRTFSVESVMYVIEMLFGIVVPLRMFMSPAVQKSPLLLFVAATLVVGGVLLNRINNFIIAYTPPYATHPYYPSFGEISVTVGFISILVLLYRVIVLNFPVISLPDRRMMPASKYSVRG
ncbi:MAG TPA: Ni/Fe-hydrogenase cytochrome b subunit [Gemmatimonadaceae bacterium]